MVPVEVGHTVEVGAGQEEVHPMDEPRMIAGESDEYQCRT